MADTYKGESLGKKCARAWLWLAARRYLGAEFLSGKHLVLASREGGDAIVLKSLGVRPSNIIAVERDTAAARAFGGNHPDVELHVADLADVLRHPRLRKALASAHLDFCGWAGADVALTSANVARWCMRDKSFLSIGFMRGRETGDAREAIRLRKQTIAAMYPDMGERVNIPGRTAHIDSSVQKILRSGPPVIARSMTSVEYNSGRTPMLYRMFSVHRDVSWPTLFRRVAREDKSEDLQAFALILADPEPSPLGDAYYREGRAIQREIKRFGRAAPADVVTLALAIEREYPTLDAAAVLTISPGRLAAWKAHATRGTYARAS